MRKIDVPTRDLLKLRAILHKHIPDREVAVFGSRATGAAKPFSDLDLAVLGSECIPPAVLADLRDELDESDLPFKVDVVEWAYASEPFRRVIERDSVPLPLETDHRE